MVKESADRIAAVAKISWQIDDERWGGLVCSQNAVKAGKARGGELTPAGRSGGVFAETSIPEDDATRAGVVG